MRSNGHRLRVLKEKTRKLNGTQIKYERNVMNVSRMVAKAVIVASLALSLAGTSWANEIKGKVSVQGIKSAENIAVYVDEIAGQEIRSAERPRHRGSDQTENVVPSQRDRKQAGPRSTSLNSDPVRHNVYWPSISGNKKLAHNLGTWPTGEKKPFQFNDLGTASAALQRPSRNVGHTSSLPRRHILR